MMPLERWTDDRLDDQFDVIRRQLAENSRRIEEYGKLREELIAVRGELTALRAEQEHVREDTHICVDELRQLKVDLDKRAQAQHDERKADRRWMIATLLTTAGLVIAALAIFIG